MVTKTQIGPGIVATLALTDTVQSMYSGTSVLECVLPINHTLATVTDFSLGVVSIGVLTEEPAKTTPGAFYA